MRACVRICQREIQRGKAACECVCEYVVLSHVYEDNIEMTKGENECVRQAEGQTELEEGRALMVLSPRCR